MPKCEACGEEYAEGEEHVCKKPEEGVGDPHRANYALEVVLAAEKSAESGKIVEL